MDVSQDWDLDTKFDLIHVRMLGDFAEKEKLLQACFDHLNPGGWVELTEWIVDLQSPNRSLEGTAFKRWNELLAEGTWSPAADRNGVIVDSSNIHDEQHS
jgi:hypothetical protein